MSCNYQIGTGQSVQFWLDTWHSKCHLSIVYPHVFALCTNPSLSVQEVIASKGAVVRFRRSLHGILLADWHEIIAIKHSYTLTSDPDSLLWRWDSKYQFTTASLYNFLSFRGVQDPYALMWWDIIVPLKVQVFMFLLFWNNILTKTILRKKNWPVIPCVISVIEKKNHLYIFSLHVHTYLNFGFGWVNFKIIIIELDLFGRYSIISLVFTYATTNSHAYGCKCHLLDYMESEKFCVF